MSDLNFILQLNQIKFTFAAIDIFSFKFWKQGNWQNKETNKETGTGIEFA